jgi:hypothetical protein
MVYDRPQAIGPPSDQSIQFSYCNPSTTTPSNADSKTPKISGASLIKYSRWSICAGPIGKLQKLPLTARGHAAVDRRMQARSVIQLLGCHHFGPTAHNNYPQ